MVREIFEEDVLDNKTLGEAANFLEIELITLLNILCELKKLEIIKEVKIR